MNEILQLKKQIMNKLKMRYNRSIKILKVEYYGTKNEINNEQGHNRNNVQHSNHSQETISHRNT